MGRAPFPRPSEHRTETIGQTEPSAVNASSALPAREDNPMPSARTSTLQIVERPITFKVTS
jgi:hypothetical protein